jgi:hypothetical protein
MTKRDLSNELTDRQMKAIPHFVMSSTLKEGCQRAKVSKNTFFTWLKNSAFKNELSRQRDLVITEALETLKGHLIKAAESLIDLLSTENENLRRQVANDLINHVLKWKETEDIESRLLEVEQIVLDRK